MKILTALFSVLFASTSFSQTLQNDNGWRPAWGLDRIDQREEALNDLELCPTLTLRLKTVTDAAYARCDGRLQPGASH